MVRHFMQFIEEGWEYVEGASGGDGTKGDGGTVVDTSTRTYLTAAHPRGRRRRGRGPGVLAGARQQHQDRAQLRGEGRRARHGCRHARSPCGRRADPTPARPSTRTTCRTSARCSPVRTETIGGVEHHVYRVQVQPYSILTLSTLPRGIHGTTSRVRARRVRLAEDRHDPSAALRRRLLVRRVRGAVGRTAWPWTTCSAAAARRGTRPTRTAPSRSWTRARTAATSWSSASTPATAATRGTCGATARSETPPPRRRPPCSATTRGRTTPRRSTSGSTASSATRRSRTSPAWACGRSSPRAPTWPPTPPACTTTARGSCASSAAPWHRAASSCSTRPRGTRFRSRRTRTSSRCGWMTRCWARYADTTTNPTMAGRISIVSGYYNTQFDDLSVTPIEGTVVGERRRSTTPTRGMSYPGGFSFTQAGYAHLNRTQHVLSAGRSASFDMTGTGFNLIGATGAATLSVVVDDQPRAHRRGQRGRQPADVVLAARSRGRRRTP